LHPARAASLQSARRLLARPSDLSDDGELGCTERVVLSRGHIRFLHARELARLPALSSHGLRYGLRTTAVGERDYDFGRGRPNPPVAVCHRRREPHWLLAS